MRKTLIIFALMLLTACQSAPVETGATPTPTVLPPLARVVDISPNAIVVPIPIDPPSFNAYINDTGYEELIGELVFGALVELAPDGTYYPELAADVPTFENGGISEDGLTVTWRLRPGVRWSDGEPFTAADVVFTWQSFKESGIYAPGFDLITNIETPDDLTAIVYYSEYYPNYRLQFGGEGTGVFPAHQCGDPAEMLQWECNLNPVSTGPFVLAEWVQGERLVFNPNPNYWVPDRPLAEQLVFTVEADAERRARQVERGTAQLDMWTEEPFLSRADDSESVIVAATNPPRFVLQLVSNLSAAGSADAAQPNPFLADVRVRQAIRYAINVSELNADVFNNRAVPVDDELFRLGCGLESFSFNPQKAAALLAEAGWTDEDGDGTRECHQCKFAPEGTPLEFDSYYYAEFGDTLAKAHRAIERMVYDVGINIHPKPKEGVELWGTWTDRGLEMRGNFNLNLWDDGYFGVDPTGYLRDIYDPRAIPTRYDPLAGLNVMRYRNLDLTTLFDDLYTPKPDAARQKLLCRLAETLHTDLPTIPLLAFPDYYLVNRRLQGVSPHIYDTITWNAADWNLVPETP